MTSPRSFDRLARIYRALEFLGFGRDLERARFAHLALLRGCDSILVIGEGDGRCLEKLVVAAPHAHIDCLDLSPAMLARARSRLAGQAGLSRVNFRQADLLATDLSAGSYDAVVTFFFLDCFTPDQAVAVMTRIHGSLRPGALWLWADFAQPDRGLARWRARAWLAVLYAFFRWQTGLSARELPDVDRLFLARGYTALSSRSWQLGLVRSVAWRHSAKSR
jgi:ubiquinone/menaquinone biosynthesis C-methylase UbiE